MLGLVDLSRYPNTGVYYLIAGLFHGEKSLLREFIPQVCFGHTRIHVYVSKICKNSQVQESRNECQLEKFDVL